MGTNYLISFIIPVWNREKIIGICLDSILSQALELSFEIIIVDDSSSDNTVLFVQDICGNGTAKRISCCRLADMMPISVSIFREMDIMSELEIRSRIHLVRLEKHQGVAMARNKGLEMAKGKYIWFVDSDDFIAKGALKKVKAILNSNIFDILRFDKQNLLSVPNTYTIPYMNEDLKIMNMNNVYDLLYMLRIGAVWCAIFRKEFIANYCFDTRFSYSEDSLFSWEVTLRAKTAAYFNVPLYGYMFTPKSLTSVKPFERFDCYISVVKGYIKAIQKSEKSEKEKAVLVKECEKRLYLHAFHTYAYSEITSEMWDRWYEVYLEVMVDNEMRAKWERLISNILWRIRSKKLFIFIYNCILKHK